MKNTEYMINFETGETREFDIFKVQEQGGIPEGFIPVGDIKAEEWIEAYKKLMSKKQEGKVNLQEEWIEFATEGLNELLKNVGTFDYDRQLMTFINCFYDKLEVRVTYNSINKAFTTAMSKDREEQRILPEEVMTFTTEGLNKLLKNVGTCDYDCQVVDFIDGLYAKLGVQIAYNSINRAFTIVNKTITSDMVHELNQKLKDMGTTIYVEEQQNFVSDKLFVSYEVKTNDIFIFNNAGIVYNEGLYGVINKFFAQYGIKLNYNNFRNQFWI